MKKHLLFSLLVLFSAFTLNAQTTVIEAKQVKAVDSLKLKADWITNIIKDSSLSGATVRNFPSTDAVVKYIANRLAHTVKYTDTAAIISGYVRELRFLDSLSAVQTRIQGKLTKSDADTYYPAIQRMIDSLTAVQTRIQSKLTKSDADTYYPAIQRMIDSLTAVQTRIQGKLTKSDADTYYPAIQRMIDSLTAVQTRIQGKLTKSDADTYYPAIQRMIDSLTAVQTRIQSKLTKSDADTYYPAIQRVLDSLTAIQSRIQTKQPLLGYTAENSANKATDFSTVNNVLYPTVQAVSTYIQSALTGVLKDRGNYDASGNTFPASGGSGSGGAIKTGDMWYISVGGTLGGKAVTAGAWVRSLTDAPGQTAGNWAIADGGFGFVPENVANKSTSTSLGTSNTAYPSQNAVKTYVDNATANASNWNTAYNKRPSSASISSSTFTLTLGDGTTVTASIPTFNQNTTGNAATTSQTNFSSLTVSGTQVVTNNGGTWNIAILGNAGTATTASNWGVIPNSLNSPEETSNLSNLIGISSSNGYAYKFSPGAVRSWIGLTNSNWVDVVSVQTITGYKTLQVASGPYNTTFYNSNTSTADYNVTRWQAAWGTIIGLAGIGGGTAGNASFRDRMLVGTQTAHSFGIVTSDALRYEVSATGNHDFKTGTALFGNTVTATQFSASSSGNIYGLSVSRGTTGHYGGVSYRTAGSEKWFGGMRETGDENYRLFSSALGNDVLVLDHASGNAGFLATVSALNFTAGNNIYLRYNGYSLLGRNAADNAYIDMLKMNSSDEVSIAGSGNTVRLGGALVSKDISVVTGTESTISVVSPGYWSWRIAGNATQMQFKRDGTVMGYFDASNNLAISGSMAAKTYTENTVTVSSNYTVASDIGTVFCDSHTYTVTLPSASSFPGREITIKRISSGFGTGITISGVTLGSSETGGSLGCHGAAVYKSNGTYWYCITYRTGGCD